MLSEEVAKLAAETMLDEEVATLAADFFVPEDVTSQHVVNGHDPFLATLFSSLTLIAKLPRAFTARAEGYRWHGARQANFVQHLAQGFSNKPLKTCRESKRPNRQEQQLSEIACFSRLQWLHLS